MAELETNNTIIPMIKMFLNFSYLQIINLVYAMYVCSQIEHQCI